MTAETCDKLLLSAAEVAGLQVVPQIGLSLEL